VSKAGRARLRPLEYWQVSGILRQARCSIRSSQAGRDVAREPARHRAVALVILRSVDFLSTNDKNAKPSNSDGDEVANCSALQ
jgi:hypothetical protein